MFRNREEALVDFDKGTVHVRATLSRLGVKTNGQGERWKLTRPKTDNSIRTVPLSPIAMHKLRLWQKKQQWERRTLQDRYQDHGEFVFTTENGRPVGNNLKRAWRRVCREAGLGEFGPEPKKPARGKSPERPFAPKYRVYDLRHTHATLWLRDGGDLLVMSRRLGHATLAITADTYGHIKAEHTTDVAESFERMFA